MCDMLFFQNILKMRNKSFEKSRLDHRISMFHTVRKLSRYIFSRSRVKYFERIVKILQSTPSLPDYIPYATRNPISIIETQKMKPDIFTLSKQESQVENMLRIKIFIPVSIFCFTSKYIIVVKACLRKSILIPI